MNLEEIMLGEISQQQKDTKSIVTLTWDIQGSQNRRGQKIEGQFSETCKRGINGKSLNEYEVPVSQDEKSFKNWLHKNMCTLHC